MSDNLPVLVGDADKSFGGVFSELPVGTLTPSETHMYNFITDRMREEAKYLQMSTPVVLLSEQIALHYVIMKKLAMEGNVGKVSLMKYHTDTWLRCTSEFNKTIARTLSQETRNLYMRRVNDVIMSALETIEDRDTRINMANLFINAVSSAGI